MPYVKTDAQSYPLQDLNFTQDSAGNVTSIFDTTTLGGTAKPDYQCFTYDGHRRLTEAWTPKTADCATTGRTGSNIDGAAPYWTSYTYTQGGQRKTETQHTSAGDQTTTYTYDDPADTKPHTLDKTTGTRAATYAYDEAGNTTSRPGPTAQQTLTWDAEGELAKLTESTKETSYLYDADGELLIRRAKGDGDTVLYVANTEVRLTEKGATKTLTGSRYYTASGQTIAVRTATAGVPGSKLVFLAADHHGTSNIAMAAGTYALTKRYTSPFGAPRGTKAINWPDDKAFLGKPADEFTGLTHVGAREYDPSVGQFISVDPVLDTTQHQSLNGYAYANNTPVTSSDPTGLWLDDGTGHSVPNPKGNNGNSSSTPGKPKGTVGKNGCYYTCGGTAKTSSSGQTLYNSDGEVLACAYGHCVGSVVEGPADKAITSVLLGLMSNIPHMAEYFAWPFDSDCRGDGEAGAPGCNYGTQFDNWAASKGYDPYSDAYEVPSALAAIFGAREGGMPRPGPRRFPMGFSNASEFRNFGNEIYSGLREAGMRDGVTAVFQGSSVTGKSYRTGKPFGPHSDFDVALTGEGLLARAKKAGIPLRSGGTRTGPLKGADLQKMGLAELRESLTDGANREVNFMIYRSVQDATSRSPSIVVTP